MTSSARLFLNCLTLAVYIGICSGYTITKTHTLQVGSREFILQEMNACSMCCCDRQTDITTKMTFTRCIDKRQGAAELTNSLQFVASKAASTELTTQHAIFGQRNLISSNSWHSLSLVHRAIISLCPSKSLKHNLPPKRQLCGGGKITSWLLLLLLMM